MQLHQNIPALGGLGEPPPRSRREQLALDGAQARQQIAGILDSARRRALVLAAVNGALLARLLCALLAAIATGLVVWFCVRSPLQRAAAAAARDPRRLARLIGGPSELLSSVELSREDPKGVSSELLSLLHVRAAATAKQIDLARA